MDNNTLTAALRLCDLAENFNDQGSTDGRDQVLDILRDLMDKVQLPAPKDPNINV